MDIKKVLYYRFFLKVILPVWVAGGLLTARIGSIAMSLDQRTVEPVSEISLEESTQEIDNPGRGFYVPFYVHYRQEDNEERLITNRLVHMRLDLAEFSGAYNKRADLDLTKDMLDALDHTLEDAEKRQGSVIIRFSYDPNFSGNKTYEPPMDVVTRHQKQLGEVLSKHADAIVVLECGLFGKWGEMHGSDACTQENFNQAIDTWLEVLPQSIPVSVRTISQYCAWSGVTQSAISEHVTKPGDKGYRVGIYDDGYLASDTDLGTFADREAETTWLSEQIKHAIFGGEAGLPYGNQQKVTPSAAYMEKEAFLTHVTYLNSNWNETVINWLKKEVFQGENQRYQGVSGYDYVRNHLGYRFVIRGVRETKEVPRTKKLFLEIDVENVGFANLVKPKETTLILKGAGEIRQYSLTDKSDPAVSAAENCDPRGWDAKRTTTMRIEIPFSEEMPLGEYKIYLRLASPSAKGILGEKGYSIRFANDDSLLWNPALGANYVASFRVTEKPEHLEWDYYKGFQIKK